MKRISFNDNWLFCRQGSKQKSVTLPHDAMMEESRSPDAKSGSACAFFPGGLYEYEKNFTVPEEWRGKTVLLQFEGVYKNSTVYINGKKAGGAAYGYIPFFVETDGLLNYGENNTIRVEADNKDQPNSRWYTGGGIYRPVWLWIGEQAHITPKGVKITTLSYQPAKLWIEVEHTGGEVSVEIIDGEKVVATAQGSKIDLLFPDARLWSDETPNLYTCRVTLSQNGAVVDTAEETFGIRMVEWNPGGLFINGKNTLLRGGCIHHDNGLLGAATYAESEDRCVRIMKEAGFNAIRSSHNPASDALLSACDRYGLYVMDESWDMWYNHKSAYDYASDFTENYKSDLRAMVEQDFNHPSVIMYSIGNEVSEPAKEKGVALAKEMVDYLHLLDRNRAVTGGMNLMIISRSAKGNGVYDEESGGRKDSGKDKTSGMNSTLFNLMTSMVGTGMNKGANSRKADQVTSPVLDALDIAGYNYASGRYPLERKAHPNRVILGSETFPQDIVKNWTMVKQYPYLVGDFMWTAWDYLGETGIGTWAYTSDGRGFDKPYPWLLADVGAFDILGNPNGELYLAQAAWGLLNQPVIAVQPVNHPGVKPAKSVWRGTNAIPTWSWRGCEGNKTVVEVYTDAYAVELFLNGSSLGKKKVKDCKASFKAVYEPGTLAAVSYDRNGNKRGESQLVSAQGKTSVSIIAEVEQAASGSIVYFDIAMVGENGQWEANADETLRVSVTGGELLGFGSANPRTEERYQSGEFATYYGKAQAIIRVGKSGQVQVTVSGKQIDGTSTSIAIAK